MIINVYNNETQIFCINGSFSNILRDVDENKVLEYFYARRSNFHLLDEPMLIENRNNIEKLIKKLENTDFQERFERPCTKIISCNKHSILHYTRDKFCSGLLFGEVTHYCN